MQYFRSLERLDALQPSLDRSFEKALKKHEETLFYYLETGLDPESLESIVYGFAQNYLDTNAWDLTGVELLELITVNKKSRSKNTVYFFRAYLFGKRAKQIYYDPNLSDKGKDLAFVYLYNAGVALGQFLADIEKINKSQHFRDLALKRCVRDSAVHEKLIELIQEKRPTEGWKTQTSMADCLADDMRPHIINAGMAIEAENVEKSILAWIRKHAHIKQVYESCSAKSQKALGKAAS